MPIKSGSYIITNIRQRNLVTLRDPNDGTPLAAGVRKDVLCERWFVQLHSNGTYSIKNIMHDKSFANAGNRAELNAVVEGRNDEQYWFIQRTRAPRQYTIRTADTRLFWALEDGQVGTPITLLDLPADSRCWWTFEDPETGTAAEINKKPEKKVFKWTNTTLGAIFSPLRKGRRKRNPEPTISDLPSSSHPELGAAIPNLITTDLFSSSQPELDTTTPNPVIAGSVSSSQPTPDAAVILLDIPFKISESKGLLDPLATISQALEKVLTSAKIKFKSDEEWKKPIRRLRFHLDTIKYHCVELEKDFEKDGIVPTPETTITGPLEKYANHLQNIYHLIGDDVRSSIMNANAEYDPNEGTIGQKIRHMDSAFEEYKTALHSFSDQVYNNMQKLPSVQQNLLVAAIKPHYMQSKRPNTYGVQHKECLPGTRQKTMKAIREWVNSTSGAKPTFLLLDAAGSGKSTVAKTMAEELGSTRLVARYFFSRDTAETRSTESFCSTVSDEFIACNPALKGPVNLFKERPNFNRLSFRGLFNGLVTGPLEQLSLDAILIIDALDECNDEDDSCTDLLEAICSQRVSTPRLRILATGRPELHITRWAQKHEVEWHNFIRLEGSYSDIDLYIQKSLQDLPNTHAPVMKLADGVFIWARIACDLILKTADVNRLLEELETVVSLDYLYKVALDQSVPKDAGSRRVFAVVLQMILASREPLSIAELEKLAPEPHIVEQIVTRLGALLVYQGREDPIRLLHATFREFLTTRPKAHRYFIQLKLGHHTLTTGCLNNIKSSLTEEPPTPSGMYDHDDVIAISRREETLSGTGYVLTSYPEFTFTRQSRGYITVHHRIGGWLWTPTFWSLLRHAYRRMHIMQTNR